ncbi:hemerythrin domain-containing protein [Azohydromonas caseinilytica]|uniref:Hemerythrin domain-containing protein n=1 Tax=Azohydromonas caseinilytica TaxID=2728836 RepID=A0A848F6L8_9BURK|nr:hemerythrin domain-containing protein [Azohydromonas caseinilytica]NML14808.1 hemerythrin domain-containing protein [Azohydromonas caseinilytica]
MSATSSLPGLHSPAAGFDEPFEVLAACHDRVRRSLDLLQRLVAHVDQHGADAQARDAARDVARYFNVAAPAHHEDEERHVLPLLRASADAALQAAAQRMLSDHERIRASWQALEPALQALQRGEVSPALPQVAQDFVQAHDGHLELEDGLAFPGARAQQEGAADGEAQREAMGREMATRRGVKPQ